MNIDGRNLRQSTVPMTALDLVDYSPQNNQDLVTVLYLNAALAGLKEKEPVRLAATENIDLLTGGLIVVDGVQTFTGDRILCGNQDDLVENGVYIAQSGTWVRALDFDDIDQNEVIVGTFVLVREGNVNINGGFFFNSNDFGSSDIAVGIDEIIVKEISSGSFGSVKYESDEDIIIFNNTTKRMRVGEELFELANTGTFSFNDPGLAINVDSTKFDLYSGRCHIKDEPNDSYYEIVWSNNFAITPAQDGLIYLAISVSNVINVVPGAIYTPINAIVNGTSTQAYLVQKPNFDLTREESRFNAFIGGVVVVGGVVTEVSKTPTLLNYGIQQFHDLLDFQGVLNKGHVPLPNGANLKVNVADGKFLALGVNSGTSTENPNIKSFIADSPITFQYMTKLAGSSTGVDTQNIVPDYYDNNGVLDNVPGAATTTVFQIIYKFITGTYRVQPSENYYATLEEAYSALKDYVRNFSPNPNTTGISYPVGAVITQKNSTDLSDILQAYVIPASAFLTNSYGGISPIFKSSYGRSLDDYDPDKTGASASNLLFDQALSDNKVVVVQPGVYLFDNSIEIPANKSLVFRPGVTINLSNIFDDSRDTLINGKHRISAFWGINAGSSVYFENTIINGNQDNLENDGVNDTYVAGVVAGIDSFAVIGYLRTQKVHNSILANSAQNVFIGNYLKTNDPITPSYIGSALEIVGSTILKETNSDDIINDFSTYTSDELKAAGAKGVYSLKWYDFAPGGTANAITVNLLPAPVSYFERMEFKVKIASNNTGPVTIDANALGPKSVVADDGSALNENDLKAGGIYAFVYDGTNLQLKKSGGDGITLGDISYPLLFNVDNDAPVSDWVDFIGHIEVDTTIEILRGVVTDTDYIVSLDGVTIADTLTSLSALDTWIDANITLSTTEFSLKVSTTTSGTGSGRVKIFYKKQ